LIVTSLLLILVIGVPYIQFAVEGFKRYPIPESHIVIPAGEEVLSRGAHLVQTLGCSGCHGEDLEGKRFIENFFVRITAPNLTRLAQRADADELERAIRHGVKSDGTSLFGMPSSSYYYLSDADVGSIIAYLYSVDPAKGETTRIHMNPLTPLILAGVKDLSSPLVAGRMDHSADRYGLDDATDSAAIGKYLALTHCSECHGEDFRGVQYGRFSTPDLAAVADYPLPEFARMLESGTGLGDGQLLPLMANASKTGFRYFSKSEVEALYAFLSALTRSAVQGAAML
jgi:cytochrome c553|tara:strand:- start:4030 stop:4884 length:855 start_codon:yes stop_codon:yes gene_type:complete